MAEDSAHDAQTLFQVPSAFETVIDTCRLCLPNGGVNAIAFTACDTVKGIPLHLPQKMAESSLFEKHSKSWLERTAFQTASTP